jgi:hypothetical protein
MPMRAELSTPAMHGVWQSRAVEVTRPLASDILKNRDFVVVAVFSAIGLLASLCLALSFPFAEDVATLLAQFN